MCHLALLYALGIQGYSSPARSVYSCLLYTSQARPLQRAGGGPKAGDADARGIKRPCLHMLIPP